jgi:hypothetical protein
MKKRFPKTVSREFDYTTVPTDIANQIAATANHVRTLQHAALAEIGRALLKVTDHMTEEQFVAWLKHECKMPAWSGQQAIHAAQFSVAAELFAPASANSERREPGPRTMRAVSKEPVTSPWVVTREADADRQRHQQEQREWGGEDNVRQQNTLMAAKMLELHLGRHLGKFLTAMSKADPDAVFDLLRDAQEAAARRKAVPAPVGRTQDEPPLPFMAAPEQTDTEVTVARRRRQSRKPEPGQVERLRELLEGAQPLSELEQLLSENRASLRMYLEELSRGKDASG